MRRGDGAGGDDGRGQEGVVVEEEEEEELVADLGREEGERSGLGALRGGRASRFV
jgi:hypothetical protein